MPQELHMNSGSRGLRSAADPPHAGHWNECGSTQSSVEFPSIRVPSVCVENNTGIPTDIHSCVLGT